MNKVSVKYKMFKEAIRQQKLITVVTLIILALQLLIVSFFVWEDAKGSHVYESYEADIYEIQPFLLAVPSIILISMIANAFSWMNKRADSDFYHSIPIKRQWLLLLNVAAAVLLCTGIFWAGTFVSVMVISLASCGTVKIVLGNLGYYFMLAFTFAMMISGAVMIGRDLSGRRGPVNLLALIILYGPRTLLFAFRTIMEDVAPYISIQGGIIWETKYNLVFFTGIDGKSWEPIIYSLILALVYWIIAAILFVKRKSEVAEQVAANSGIQMFIRLFLAFIVSILPNSLIIAKIFDADSYDYNAAIFSLYAVAVAVYFLYELITTKKVGRLSRIAPGVGVLVALNLAMIIGCCGYISYHKNAKITEDNIVSIELQRTSEKSYYYYSSYNNSMLPLYEAYTGKAIKSESLNCEFVNKLEDVKDGDSYISSDLVFKVKTTGGTYYRRVNISMTGVVACIRGTDFASKLKLDMFVSPDKIDKLKTSESYYSAYKNFYEDASNMSTEAFADYYLDCIIYDKLTYLYLVDNKNKTYEYYIPDDYGNDQKEYR